MSNLTDLLRQRLSRTDAHDITDDFGNRAGLGASLYERLAEGGLDERLAALVRRAEQTRTLPHLLAAIHATRPDLDAEAQAVADAAPIAPTAPPQTGNVYNGAVFQGGTVHISGTNIVFGGENIGQKPDTKQSQ